MGLIEAARLDHVVTLGGTSSGWVAAQPDAHPVPGILPDASRGVDQRCSSSIRTGPTATADRVRPVGVPPT